jgi:hypothetical protein
MNPFILFFVIKKCRDNEKKYYVLIFVKKREKKKKRVFFCGVLFREDSFRDIVREKEKKNLSMMRVMYKQRMLQKRGEVFASGLRKIGE